MTKWLNHFSTNDDENDDCFINDDDKTVITETIRGILSLYVNI